MRADPLSSYPSVKQMSKLSVYQWFELGLHLGLTEDELHSMEEGQNHTASTLVAAKVKNIELKWKDIVASLVRIGEYQQAERVCTEQGGLISIASKSVNVGQSPNPPPSHIHLLMNM